MTVQRETSPLVLEIIKHQQRHAKFGELYTALYEFTERTLRRFFRQDLEMPLPLLRCEEIPGVRRALYRVEDGTCLPNVITLDPFMVDTAWEWGEILAHELVHLWQHHLGYELKNNVHNQEFHDKMMDYGIATSGESGDHVGAVENIWMEWMDENEDLDLDKFKLGWVGID